MPNIPCPIPGYEFATFGGWSNVALAYSEKVSLYYKAPLDTAPRPVFVLKHFRNGKLRVTVGETTFTADASHLDRFYWIQKKQ